MKLFAMISMLIGVSVCASADTTWVLDGVTSSDGAVVTGWYTINDPLFTALDAWSIMVVGSAGGANDFDFESSLANDSYSPGSVSDVKVAVQTVPSFTNFVLLNLVSGMEAGGTIALDSGNSFDFGPGGLGSLSGFVSETPEPGSLLLAASGLAAVLAYRKRHLFKA
jgi:PEP-CTERM motif